MQITATTWLRKLTHESLRAHQKHLAPFHFRQSWRPVVSVDRRSGWPKRENLCLERLAWRLQEAYPQLFNSFVEKLN